jgi:hypothetical protein
LILAARKHQIKVEALSLLGVGRVVRNSSFNDIGHCKQFKIGN